MYDEKNEISISSESVVSREKSTITNLDREEKVTVRRTADHSEVLMMESTWKQIKRKVNLISIHKRIDIFSIMLGVAIPYTIDVISAHINETTPNYLPLCICGLLMAACKMLSKIITVLGDDHTEANIVHLKDLKALIEQADATLKEPKASKE